MNRILGNTILPFVLLIGCAQAETPPVASSKMPARPGSVVAAPDKAQTSPQTSPQTSQGFVNAVAQNIRLQQQASLLAMTKAASEEVRSFAQKTLDEQDRLLQGLQSAVLKQRSKLPQETDAATQSKLDALRAKNGQHFDQLYTADVNAAREDSIALLRNAVSAPGVSPTLKNYARKMLPEMERQAAISTPLTRPK